MIRRFALIPAVALAVAAFALVSTTAASAATQSTAGLSQPFLAWGDNNYYSPVPGGSFEPGAPSWTLSSGAAVAPGNEPFNVAGAGLQSLSLSPGASATSPTFTVDASDPTLRFFDKAEGSGALQVSINVAEFGQTVSIPVGVLHAGDWAPTDAIRLPSVLFGSGTDISVTLTALGGSFRADDVYVDPTGMCC